MPGRFERERSIRLLTQAIERHRTQFENAKTKLPEARRIYDQQIALAKQERDKIRKPDGSIDYEANSKYTKAKRTAVLYKNFIAVYEDQMARSIPKILELKAQIEKLKRA